MNPPRILHVVSTRDFVGGAERVMLALLEEGEARGWQQLVLNPFAAARTGTPFHRAVSEITECVSIPGASVAHLVPLRRELGQRIRDFAPDLIHVHLFHALVATATVRRRGEARLLSHQHGRLYASQGRQLQSRLDRLAAPRYERIVACSDDVRDYLVGEYGLPPERTLTIHNGWEGTPHAESGLADRPTAVCVANHRREKGHSVLLDAWKRVVASVPDADLLLVGDGPLRGDIEDRIAELGLGGNVTLVGAVDDVWPHLAQAHLFVLATLHEPFGIVAAEAMAAGLPVITSDVGGLPEFVTPGVNGELVPIGDDVALARHLVALFQDPERREQLASQARRTAADYTVAKTVERYMDVYAEMLGE